VVLRPRLSVEFALYNLVDLTLADHGEKCINLLSNGRFLSAKNIAASRSKILSMACRSCLAGIEFVSVKKLCIAAKL